MGKDLAGVFQPYTRLSHTLYFHIGNAGGVLKELARDNIFSGLAFSGS